MCWSLNLRFCTQLYASIRVRLGFEHWPSGVQRSWRNHVTRCGHMICFCVRLVYCTGSKLRRYVADATASWSLSRRRLGPAVIAVISGSYVRVRSDGVTTCGSTLSSFWNEAWLQQRKGNSFFCLYYLFLGKNCFIIYQTIQLGIFKNIKNITFWSVPLTTIFFSGPRHRKWINLCCTSGLLQFPIGVIWAL